MCMHTLCHTSATEVDQLLKSSPRFNVIMEKGFNKTSFHIGMSLKKVRKQGKDERTQEDYPTSAKITADVGKSSCVLSSLSSFSTFFRSIPE